MARLSSRWISLPIAAVVMASVACGCGRDRRGRSAADAGTGLPDAGPRPEGPCTPFDVRTCYTGPAGTRGVGACRPGYAECDPATRTFGACEGEVLPADEDCDGTLADEDCDGEVNESGPACLCAAGSWEPCWEGPAEARGVGACRDGQHVCDELGLAWGECVAQVLPAPEDGLRPFDEDCDGEASDVPLAFAFSFGGPSTGAYEDGERVTAIDAAPGGGFAIAGVAAGSFELGGVSLPAGDGGAQYDAFVARLDADGDVLWAKRFVGDGRNEGSAVAIGPSGEVVLGGSMGGTVDFGGGPRTGSGLFVAVFEADGTHRFSDVFTGDDDDLVRDLELDAAGNLYLAARASRMVDLGGGALSGNSALASFDSTGAHRFSIAFTAARSRLAVGPTGVAIAGNGTASLSNDFGAGPIDGDFVAGFSLDGDLEWAQAFDGYGDLMDVTRAPDGTVYAIGANSIFASFDGLPVLGDPEADLYLAELAPDGELRSVRIFGSGVLGPADYGSPQDIELTGDGRLLVVGSFDGVLDLGSGPVPGIAQEDHFVALLSTDAETVHYVQRFGTPARDYWTAIRASADDAGAVYLGGWFLQPIDFGLGPFVSRGASDSFVVGLEP